MIASAAVLVGLVAGIIGTTIGLVSQSRQRAIAERERAEAQLNFATALQSQRKYAEAEDLYRRELEIPSGDTPADRQRAALTRLRLAEVVSDRSGAGRGRATAPRGLGRLSRQHSRPATRTSPTH